MNILFRIVLGVTTIHIFNADAYVFLQVRKGDNQSNVDAVIHKVVPNNREATGAARKRLSSNHRYEMHGRQGPKFDQDKGLESVVVAINTGADPNKVDAVRPNIMRKMQEVLVDFLKDDRVNAFFRSKTDTYKVKPEIVHFKSGKPSLMLEVDFQSIMKSVKDALRSKKVKQYTDTVVRNAASIYRALKEEVKKDDRGNAKEFYLY